MKAIVCLGTIGLLTMSSSLLATDFTWAGEASTDLFTETTNWDPDGVPTGGDSITLGPLHGSTACIYNLTTTTALNSLTLAGLSPTKMKLHIRDGNLEASNSCTLQDHAWMVADKDFLANDSQWSGTLYFDIAANADVSFGNVDVQGAGVTYNGISAALLGSVNATGTFTASTLDISAEVNALTTGLLFEMADSELTVTTTLLVEAGKTCSSCTDNKRATLWVQSGTVRIASGGQLDIRGGPDAIYRRAVIEVADDLISAYTTIAGPDGGLGYTFIDVALGDTFKGGDLNFSAGAIANKTGAGTVKSGS